ncbi:DUF485 domain-containing protein [Tardiphaga alba]|uniref:DUF485 domain-containing protein n=1 Tax=Tardiphaga alba TaxID=340268 RepID=A0ABX8A6F3_9BRAD|nr:DUF485 domain-containing protein [Tardiphaga alba]QUS38073.1 DUF485 domain-containing protein [Tardiphaga alba]
MNAELIQQNVLFRQLSRERSRFGFAMSAMMAVSYFAFIMVIAFRPSLLGLPLGTGTTTTWGVVVAVALIALGFILTAVYVARANSRFDQLKDKLLEDLR